VAIPAIPAVVIDEPRARIDEERIVDIDKYPVVIDYRSPPVDGYAMSAKIDSRHIERSVAKERAIDKDLATVGIIDIDATTVTRTVAVLRLVVVLRRHIETYMVVCKVFAGKVLLIDSVDEIFIFTVVLESPILIVDRYRSAPVRHREELG
jgi:hypothetical protein